MHAVVPEPLHTSGRHALVGMTFGIRVSASSRWLFQEREEQRSSRHMRFEVDCVPCNTVAQ